MWAWELRTPYKGKTVCVVGGWRVGEVLPPSLLKPDFSTTTARNITQCPLDPAWAVGINTAILAVFWSHRTVCYCEEGVVLLIGTPASQALSLGGKSSFKQQIQNITQNWTMNIAFGIMMFWCNFNSSSYLKWFLLPKCLQACLLYFCHYCMENHYCRSVWMFARIRSFL